MTAPETNLSDRTPMLHRCRPCHPGSRRRSVFPALLVQRRRCVGVEEDVSGPSAASVVGLQLRRPFLLRPPA